MNSSCEDHDQQRHDGEVLEEQDADDVASVSRIELNALGENAKDDRGRRHGERAPDREAGLPRRARKRRCGEHRGERERDLGQSEAEDRAAQLKKLRQAELEPDREHQEHDAEFREMPSLLGVGNPRERERSDGDPDQQIAEQRRQMQEAEEHHHQYRACEQDQHQFKRVAHSEVLVSLGSL